MSNIDSINLHFDDYSESYYIIRFGKKKYLEQIRDGYLRFSSIKKYQNIENVNIGDNHEGLSSIHYTDKNTRILFSHPHINTGKQIDVTNSLLSIWNYPNNNIYISCFSYFTAKDILEKSIFDDKILMEKEWDNVLFILDTKGFVENIFKALNDYNLSIGKVKYLNYDINQESLDAFSKSDKYRYQKELRLTFNFTDKENKIIKRICEDTIEVAFKKVQSVIIPTNEFREGFYY
jgi:hypothetical protein